MHDRLDNRPHRAGLLAVLVVMALAWGCGDDSEGTGARSGEDAPPTETPTSTKDGAEVIEVTADSFRNLNDMTAVRGFFVDNLVGDLDATLAVARSEDGGTYPVGSLIQLVPGEAMVKQPEGFSPGTRDWEFFELDVDESGTTIRVSGGVEVVNRFGGSCADCHARADPQFDFVCEDDHGCDPLPIGRPVIEQIQRDDPRPRT